MLHYTFINSFPIKIKMSDSFEIASMFSANNKYLEPQYQEVRYLQVTDTNQGNYQDGKISLNLESNKAEFTVLSDSFLVVPLRISNGTATSTYAIKNSLVSLISGLQVQTSSGTTLVNESNFATPIIANLKMMIDSSIDFKEANEMHYFGQDKHVQLDVSLAGKSIVGGVTPTVTAATPTIDALQNVPLSNRISVFTTRSTKTVVGITAVYTQDFIAYIPLKFVHSLFQVLDFPMVNCPLQITFNISGISGQSGYCPFTCPIYGAHSSLGDIASGSTPAVVALVAGATKPALSVFPGASEKGYAPGVRLFLKAVKLPTEAAIELRSQMEAGYKKSLVFTSTQYFTYPQAAQLAASSYSLTQQVASNVIRPTRCWVLPVRSGTLASEANSFPAVISQDSQFLTNTNIQINNQNFYNMNLRSQYEFYRLLKEQMQGGTSSMSHNTPISYDDFLNGCNPYVFDLSRYPTVKANTMCTISVNTDIVVPSGNVPALDLIVLIEHLETMVLDISTAGVSIVTRKGD